MIAAAAPAAPVPIAADPFDEFVGASGARRLGTGAHQEGVKAVHIENSFGHANGRLTAMRATVGSTRSLYQAIDGVVDAHAFRVALPASYLVQARDEALATMNAGLGRNRVDLYVEDWRAGGALSVSYKVGPMRVDAVGAAWRCCNFVRPTKERNGGATRKPYGVRCCAKSGGDGVATPRFRRRS